MGALVLRSSCEAARRRAALAPDGELSVVEVGLLRAHLRICAACAAFAGEVEAITWMLRGEPL